MNLLKGYCFMGQKCSFAHTLDEWNPIACSASPCKKYGCNYFHAHETKKQYATKLRLDTTKLNKPIYVRYGHDSDDEDEDEDAHVYKKLLLADTEEDQIIFKLVSGMTYRPVGSNTEEDVDVRKPWISSIERGDISTIKKMTREGVEGYDVTMMDLACALDQFEIAAYLHFYRREGCTPNAMDEAAKNGHMRIVRFLHLVGWAGTVKAVDNAALAGHFPIVQYLCFYRSEGFTHNAFESTNQDILDFLETVSDKLRE